MKDWKKTRTLYQIPLEKRWELFNNLQAKFFSKNELENYIKELNENVYLKEYIKLKSTIHWKKRWPLAQDAFEIMYALVRKIKPKIIIETGVYHGCSTSMFLIALDKNKKGKLISIDKCDTENLGKFIPEKVKYRWELKKGLTKDILPTINKKIDIFFHDSTHTYSNMMMEYQWAINHLRQNKLLMSHDIGTNNAFFDFAKKYNFNFYLIKTIKSNSHFGVGLIIKDKKPILKNVNINKYLNFKKGEDWNECPRD